MKKFVFLSLMAVFLFAGHAMAADLSGTWLADNLCVPGDDPVEPWVPKQEDSTIIVVQMGMFFTTTNLDPQPGEECGGVIDGKALSMTCPPGDVGTGTIFHGELKGPNTIIGVNHKPDEGVTCSIVAIRQ